MKKTKQQDEQPLDALSLSFLDVLSCGLASMLILFFVFSVLPQDHEKLSNATPGRGKDEKVSQSGVRAKGVFSRPNRSPFGCVVIAEGCRGLSNDDIEWEVPDQLEWVTMFQSTDTEKNNFQFSGITENVPNHFKKVKCWVNTNKLQGFFTIDVIGTTQVGFQAKIDLTKMKSQKEKSQKDGKTLVFTIDRMQKNEWIKSDFENVSKTPHVQPSENNGETKP